MTARAARDWDAATYDRVSEPQVAWGREVLGRLPLRGYETVLDAGCGSGRVTALLIERLPRGRVVAVDSAPSMVEKAREALGHRATVRLADLTELHLDEPVEAVFSSAVFHWIQDHDLLFERLHAALRAGGRLVAQCGGAGNVRHFHDAAEKVMAEVPYASFLADFSRPWHFASAEQTASRLGRVGFTDVRCWLAPSPVMPRYTTDYLRTVCLGPHLAALPAELRDGFVERVAATAPQPVTLDYVRLNIEARRP